MYVDCPPESKVFCPPLIAVSSVCVFVLFKTVLFNYNTRYSAKQNFYKSKIKTNAGKQSLSYMAIDIWKDLPSSLKDLSVLVFPKYIKRYLLSTQKLNQFFT